MSLRFDEQVVVITGVGHGIGHQIAKHLAAAGAKVFITDQKQETLVREIAGEINEVGGVAFAAVPPLHDVTEVLRAAIAHSGRIDVLINNASIFLDENWASIDTSMWDQMLETNLRTAYKCVQTAWPHFRKQKYGRILGTASLTVNDMQSESVARSTALYSDLGFVQTIAKEGAKYNILANTLSSSERIQESNIDGILQTISMLVHSSNTSESGHMYRHASKRCSKLRWQRSKGTLLNPGPSMKPMSILERWNEINDFSQATYPVGSADFPEILSQTRKLQPCQEIKETQLKGKIALVTGAGSGLGRAYAKYLAACGATVVLNDIKDPQKVADEIKDNEGDASIVTASVDDGRRIVESCIQRYDHLDIIVNNAGFVRDKSIGNMTDDLWDSIIQVHLKGAYRVSKAAWPYMVKQKYGRIVNITSTSGIYGNFGQSNYSTAKCGIIGFSEALAKEGRKHNILVNTLAPVASTPALGVALQGSSTELLPEYVAPFLALMVSDLIPSPSSGGIYEVGAGWHARTRLQSSYGVEVKCLNDKYDDKTLSRIADFSEQTATYPELGQDGFLGTKQSENASSVSDIVEQVKSRKSSGTSFKYFPRDTILYNLSLGARWSELPLIYEQRPEFEVLPTFGAIPFFGSKLPFRHAEIVPKWDPKKYLHGEHYLEIQKYPIPTQGELITYPQLLGVVDKGNAALISVGYSTKNANSGEDVFYNELTIFVREAGGFGGPSQRIGRYVPSNVPAREPDAVREESTTEEQAALYRLNGDTNDLHVDPAVAQQAGYPRPILHGLCFFGISGKHIYQSFGPFKNIGVRFAGVVLPGQTLRTEMWKEERTASNHNMQAIVFQTRVIETGKLCIAGGRAEILQLDPKHKL